MNRVATVRMINLLLAAGCIAVAATLWFRSAPPPQVLVTAAPAVPAGHDTPTPGTNAAEEALRTILPGIDKPSIPFDEAVKTLQDAAHVPIVVRWKELERGGVFRNNLIDLHVRPESSLRDALRNVAQSLNRKMEPNQRVIETMMSSGLVDPLAVDFQIEDGQIVISLIQDLSRYKTTIVYNVRDILDASVSLAAPRLHEQATSRRGAVARLIKLLAERTGISTPFSSGFTEQSAIQEMMGLLVVTLSPRQQEIIVAVLQALREGSRELPPASRPVFGD